MTTELDNLQSMFDFSWHYVDLSALEGAAETHNITRLPGIVLYKPECSEAEVYQACTPDVAKQLISRNAFMKSIEVDDF